MSAEILFTTIFGALVAGAAAVWLFMKNILAAKDKELKAKDLKMEEKDKKMEQMQQQITKLEVALARVEGKVEATTHLMQPFQDLSQKLDEIKEAVQKQPRKPTKIK
jgi:septal ring factor EnvC (AmiA/AmiB activator)